MQRRPVTVEATDWTRKVVDIHGPAGEAWLQRLPALLQACARRWSLTILAPFRDLSYNYVTPATGPDGTPLVLKVGVPHRELLRELEALRCFEGVGMVRLIDADPNWGVLVLERLLPGRLLAMVEDDEQVTRVAAGVMRRLWRAAPAQHSFATVAGWAGGLGRLRATFDGGYGPFPRTLVDRAQALFCEFLGGGDEPLLIHGDMHPLNILESEREPWLAIDPKGVTGHPLFDVATFVCSLPDSEPDLKRGLQRRVGQLSELLGFDQRLIRDWALAQAVLSGWWSYEDHGCGWEGAFARAALLDEIL